MSEPSPGDLRVWYVPQLPMKAFKVEAPDLATAVLLLDTLQSFSLFEFKNRVKPDYSDVGGITRYDDDGEGGHDWFDVEDYEIDEVTA